MINSLFYIGSLNPNSNSYRRYTTYSRILDNVSGLDIDPYIYSSVTKKIDYHLNFGIGVLKFNKALFKIDFLKYDLLLIDNRPYIFKRTLDHIRKKNPKIKIALVLTDDPNGRWKSGWRLLKKTANCYDIHFVQRKQNVCELYEWGANRVEICLRSFDPSFHRRMDNISKDKNFQIGFIGSYEEEREESIVFLINNNINVQVTGDGWEKGKFFDIIKPYYNGPSIYGEDYVKKINTMPIALHFLRKGNRDEQDSRTFEIPACGTPMIAEFTQLHSQLFEENKEVLFFKNNIELLEKVKFLIENPEVASNLAINASKRCQISGYDHLNTLKQLLDKIKNCE